MNELFRLISRSIDYLAIQLRINSRIKLLDQSMEEVLAKLQFLANEFVHWPVRMLTIGTAVNSGTATTATLQLLRYFLTNGTAYLVSWFNLDAFRRYGILVERRKESSKPRTTTS